MSKGKINEAHKIVFRKPLDDHDYFELEKVKQTRADLFKVDFSWEWFRKNWKFKFYRHKQERIF